MFLHNPLTGIGVGNYVYANGMKYWPAPGRKHWLDAHSLYFKVLGELGLLGMFTFFGFVWYFYRTNSRMRERMRGDPDKYPLWMQYYPTACNIDIIGLLYCGYAYHDLFRDTWYTMAGVSAAMYLILQREIAEQAETDKGNDTAAGAASIEPALLKGSSLA